jgi:hypothetical protein
LPRRPHTHRHARAHTHKHTHTHTPGLYWGRGTAPDIPLSPAHAASVGAWSLAGGEGGGGIEEGLLVDPGEEGGGFPFYNTLRQEGEEGRSARGVRVKVLRGVCGWY